MQQKNDSKSNVGKACVLKTALLQTKAQSFICISIQLSNPGSYLPRDRSAALNFPVTHKRRPRGKDSGTEKATRDPGKRLTRHRAVNVTSGTPGAHLEHPGAQQVRIGAVGRSVGAHGADSPKHQQQGSAQGVGPGTHG